MHFVSVNKADDCIYPLVNIYTYVSCGARNDTRPPLYCVDSCSFFKRKNCQSHVREADLVRSVALLIADVRRPHICQQVWTPENTVQYSHVYTHRHTHAPIRINQWEAGGMRHKIFTSNEYSAESSFVSSPTTVLQLNIYSCLNKWNKAHNLNTIDVSLRVSVHHTGPVSLHGYARCRQLSKSVIWINRQVRVVK